jgi:acetyltransferase
VMTIRNLEFLFKPKSIALIGASKRPGPLGTVLARNLLRSGFEGPVMPVNPIHRAPMVAPIAYEPAAPPAVRLAQKKTPETRALQG